MKDGESDSGSDDNDRPPTEIVCVEERNRKRRCVSKSEQVDTQIQKLKNLVEDLHNKVSGNGKADTELKEVERQVRIVGDMVKNGVTLAMAWARENDREEQNK